MNVIRKTTRSAAGTEKLAARVARAVRPGAVVCLEGEIGSGKTTFMKGFMKAIGGISAEDVTSPTFVLMHIYSSRIPVYHFDLYRLNDSEELDQIGFEEYLEDNTAVKCIEWPDRAGDRLPSDRVTVRIRVTRPPLRDFRISGLRI